MNLYTSKTEAAAKRTFDAAQRGDKEAVLRLIDHSFNIEDCDRDGNSLLHYAVKGKNLDLVAFLVETCGMDPAWANQAMVTPWDLAKGNAPLEEYFQSVCGFSRKHCYRNPVCRGMHPDPSILRVGDDYYMVNSSFLYFPSIPISHSKDLVHWNVIGYGVTDRTWAEEFLGGLEGGRGFWAPDISYDRGRFYICATLRNNDDAPYIQTQMVTSASKPEGPYDTPVIHNVLGIDPSIFTDDDGKRYMLINRGARIMEISEDGKKILSKPSLIWYGHSGHAPEGPHILKKDGWYYCFLAEGGTGKGHMISVARSKSLLGPYENCPYNPIMHQKDEMGVIQCCGHGKPVQTPDGRWFMAYLCSRFIDHQWGMLGRETCLDEVTWTADGWPVINKGKGPSYMAALPFPDMERRECEIPDSEAWLSPRTKDPELVGEDRDGTLWIKGDGQDLNQRECRSLLVKCQPDFQFSMEFEMSFPDEGKEEFTSDAGVTLYYDENTYIKFGVTEAFVFVSEYVDDTYVRTETSPFRFHGPVTFRVETDGLVRTFFFNNMLLWQWTDVTSICSEGLSKGKRFTGAMYGVYVNGKNLLRWRQHGNVQ
ncbi:family 43 glycosylhydrolase [Lacrimispora sp.]|uniref:family 43 glycosylhydrolase n=1 Tax=Lacrimispora sp. TaxID=2719234 RepID=UPI002FD95BC9